MIKLLLSCGVLLCVVSLKAQKPDLSNWSTNGSVNTIATDNDYAYIGGSFSVAGAVAGGGVKLTASSHQYDRCFPRIEGQVTTAVPDGSGGWYIGGSFTSIGGVTRINLAHILTGGSIDMSWDPNPDGDITSIAISGSDIYVAGGFTSIGGQTRNFIAKLNNTNGNADATWNANADNVIYSIAVSGSDIYAGGEFNNIGGAARNYIAKLNNTNGNADATWDASANAAVNVISINGTDVFAGGAFTNIGGSGRNYIAKLNNTNGNADATWNPSADAPVLSVAINGSVIYAGGYFANIGGQARTSIAKLNNTDGSADATWNANSDNIVYTIALSGSDVYAGGDFTTIGGQSRSRIAKLNNTTGDADATWYPEASGGTVFAIAINGSDVYAGGAFSLFNAVQRNNIARFSLTTGMADNTWNPDADNVINTIAVSGNDIYAGGNFTTIGGQSRNRIAKLNNTNGNADATWNANANSTVQSIAVSSNDIYAAGFFTTIGGQSRNHIAKLNNTNGNADATWNPNADDLVMTVYADGSNIYAGGDFAMIGGQTRNYIAKLNNTNGNADATWDANANDEVYVITSNGSDIFAGGFFTTIGGQSRNYIAKLNNTNGNADATWNPNADNFVYTIAVDGSDIFAGGNFTTIGGQTRLYAAKLNNTNGNANSNWDVTASSAINTMLVNGAYVFTGGTFNFIASTNFSFLVKLPLSDAYVWTGYSSSDWSAACNWSYNTTPASTDNVVIPAGTTYAPDINSSSYSVKDITLNNGATLQTSSGTLTVTGNLINNGTITNSTSGKVSLAGSSAQAISGSGTITNLTLNNSNGATITSGQTNITGTLTVSSGTFTTGGFLTLKSSATATARVAQLVGSISGNVTAERYIPAKSARKWTYIACPVNGNTIRNGWQDDVFITGAGSGGTYCGTGGAQYNSNGFDASQFSSPSMYVYNVTPVSGSRWVSVGNPTSTNLTPGTGYRMNIRGPRGTSDANCTDQLTSATPSAPVATTLSATGTLMQGNVDVPVYGKTNYNFISGSGNAYTLIGNPYACEVSLQSFVASNSSNITTSFWFFTPLNGNATYCTYNSATQQALDFPSGYSNGSGVTDVIIASGQAFFVERSGNADVNVTFQESHKVSTVVHGNNFYKTQSTITDRIKVEYTNLADAESKASVFINYINDPATSATAITPFDSYSFNTGNPFYLVSQKAGRALSIQTKPAFSGNDTVSLTIKGDAGNYRLSFSEYNDFTSASEIKLIDAFLGTETNIRLQPQYNFAITGNTASQGASRFKIVFRSTGILPITGIQLSGEQKAGGNQLKWIVLAEKEMNEYLVERSADGKNFSSIAKQTATNNNSATATYEWLDAKPLNGASYYRIKAIGKNGSSYYSTIIKLQQGKAITLHVYPNPVTDKLNMVLSNGTGLYSLRIINSFGQQVMMMNNISAMQGSIRINTQNLSKGVYTVQAINTKGEVITERFAKQ